MATILTERLIGHDTLRPGRCQRNCAEDRTDSRDVLSVGRSVHQPRGAQLGIVVLRSPLLGHVGTPRAFWVCMLSCAVGATLQNPLRLPAAGVVPRRRPLCVGATALSRRRSCCRGTYRTGYLQRPACQRRSMGLVRGSSRVRHQLVRAHRGAPEHERRVRRHLWLRGRDLAKLAALVTRAWGVRLDDAQRVCVLPPLPSGLRPPGACARGYGWSVRGAPFASVGLACAWPVLVAWHQGDVPATWRSLDSWAEALIWTVSMSAVTAGALWEPLTRYVGTVAQDVRSLWRLHGLWRALVEVHPDVMLVRSSLTMRPRVRLSVASSRSATAYERSSSTRTPKP